MISEKDYKKAIAVMTADGDTSAGTYAFKIGTTEDGTDIMVVLGWDIGYDDGELYQVKEGSKLYTLCGKVAYNCDDMQCDFDWDWYMPVFDNGDVFDTHIAITGYPDMQWLEREALACIKFMNEKKLRIVEGK